MRSHSIQRALRWIPFFALPWMWTGVAQAVQVRGTIVRPAADQTVTRSLGFTRTRIAGPSALRLEEKMELALFLRVKDSLPLPAPNARHLIKIRGLQLEPGVVSCAVDESIEFRNTDLEPVSLSVGSTSLGKIRPGQSATYNCQSAGSFNVKALEWPHFSGFVFVGEVGVTADVARDGSFKLNAPEGRYELEMIGLRGVLARREVVLGKQDVELGMVTIDPSQRGVVDSVAAETPPAPVPAPVPVAAPPPAPVRPAPAPVPAPAVQAPPPKPAAVSPPKPQPKPAPDPSPAPKVDPKPPEPKAKPPEPKKPDEGDEIFELEP